MSSCITSVYLQFNFSVTPKIRWLALAASLTADEMEIMQQSRQS